MNLDLLWHEIFFPRKCFTSDDVIDVFPTYTWNRLGHNDTKCTDTNMLLQPKKDIEYFIFPLIALDVCKERRKKKHKDIRKKLAYLKN